MLINKLKSDIEYMILPGQDALRIATIIFFAYL